MKLCEHILHRTEDKNPKGVMMLFFRGVSIGYRVTYAPTPLHIAALKGHLQICSLMIGHNDGKRFDFDTFTYGCHSWTFEGIQSHHGVSN